MKHWFVLLLTGVIAARAHDPYEITSVVYVQSNRLELFVEMEFPTGMTLAGQEPSREATARSQFETALPQLEKLAGAFLEITAGNHTVLPLWTNVQLGVEDHIRFRVEFAPTDYRPLRFVPRGLRGAEASPYGISLTVLDMVRKKVLGQTTLFADSPAVELPMTPNPAAPPLAAPLPAVTSPGTPPLVAADTNTSSRDPPADKPDRSRSLAAMIVIVSVGIVLVAARLLKARV